MGNITLSEVLWQKSEGLYYPPLIARFMGPTWGPFRANRTQVGPMLAPWTLSSGFILTGIRPVKSLLTGDEALIAIKCSMHICQSSGLAVKITSLSSTGMEKYLAFHRICENYQPRASYQIRKIVACACDGNAGNVFPATDFKETAS